MAINFATILGMLPLIMRAVNLAQEISASGKSGGSVIDIIKSQGPEVLDLITEAGGALFPELSKEDQAQAGATRFDPAIVSKIQTKLNELGATPALVVDGDYGKLTKAAVTEFQKKNNLEADGWAGPLTQAVLFK